MRGRAYRTDPGSGDAIPIYSFVDPYNPDVEITHACYVKSGNPVDGWRVQPGQFYSTIYSTYYDAPYEGPGLGQLPYQEYWYEDPRLPVKGQADDLDAGVFYPACTTSRLVVYGISGWDADSDLLGIQIQSGAAIGQTRLIKTYEPFIITTFDYGDDENWDFQVVTVDPPLSVAPAWGDRYDIFVNCSGYSQVVFGVARQHGTPEATDGFIQVVLLDYNKPGQISKYFVDQAYRIHYDNRFTVDAFFPQNPSRRLDRYAVECKGALGAKLSGNHLGITNWGYGSAT